MLIAKARTFRAAAWDLTTGAGEPLGAFLLSDDRDSASVTLGEQRFRLARAGVTSGPWQLREGDEVLFEANPPANIPNRLLTTVKGAVLEIAPKGRGNKHFGVVGPDWADLGEIRMKPPFGRTLHADLSDLIPRPAQVFLVFQAVAISRGLPLG